MALQQKNYDPAIMAGADLDLTLDLGEILDSNSNEMIEFDAVASAVNYFRMVNSATGNAVDLQAQGDDSNVGFKITPKGTGTVQFVTATTSSITTGGAIDLSNLGSSQVMFLVNTTNATPIAPSGTTANVGWIKIQVAGSTARYIAVYV
ncbi:MAG: hypothetical protein NUV85_03840 [Candidatus Berkelbacteria bacterium]|nr:hypothetical protein [Candidatus Berkelbacteria bacterium]